MIEVATRVRRIRFSPNYTEMLAIAETLTPVEVALVRDDLEGRLKAVDAIIEEKKAAKAEANGDGDAGADMLFTKRLAALWKMPVGRVRDWCRTGILPARKVGRQWVVPRAALDEWLKAGGKGKVGR